MNGGEQIVWGVHLINEPDQPGERVAARDLWPLHGGGQEEEADKAQELCNLLSSQHFVTHCRALPGNDPDANHPGHKCQNVYGNSRWNKGNPSVQGQSQIPVRKPLGNGPAAVIGEHIAHNGTGHRQNGVIVREGAPPVQRVPIQLFSHHRHNYTGFSGKMEVAVS